MKTLRIIVILAVISLAGCGSDDDGSALLPPGSTLSGTITLEANVTDACVGIGVDGDASWENSASKARKVFRASGSSISYSISNVPAGTHYLFAVVDRDGHSPCTVNGIEIVVGDFVGYYGGVLTAPPSSPNAAAPSHGALYDITPGVWGAVI